MLATTTPTIEGKRITKYYGIVTGETIIGANLFRDFFASIRDIVGGRSGSYEEKCESNCMCNGSSNSNYCNPDGICAGSRRESDRKLLAFNGR